MISTYVRENWKIPSSSNGPAAGESKIYAPRRFCVSGFLWTEPTHNPTAFPRHQIIPRRFFYISNKRRDRYLCMEVHFRGPRIPPSTFLVHILPTLYPGIETQHLDCCLECRFSWFCSTILVSSPVGGLFKSIISRCGGVIYIVGRRVNPGLTFPATTLVIRWDVPVLLVLDITRDTITMFLMRLFNAEGRNGGRWGWDWLRSSFIIVNV